MLNKRECCNWTTIVKKIICYSDQKAKNINTFGFETLKKTDKNKINSGNLTYLKNYTKFYIIKYLEFYEKSNV